eukprot:scaffold585_cov237-Pinguiococcus_pyrenoidosus.AAC.9
MASKSYRMERVMMNKAEQHSIRVVEELQPGEHEVGNCQCFSCVPLCACCLVLPCCVIPESIAGQLRDSRYIYVKETSIEWNDPRAVCLEGGFLCGIDPCNYRVQDDVTVLYYDDPLLNEITDQTRCCNDCRTSCFGVRRKIPFRSFRTRSAGRIARPNEAAYRAFPRQGGLGQPAKTTLPLNRAKATRFSCEIPSALDAAPRRCRPAHAFRCVPPWMRLCLTPRGPKTHLSSLALPCRASARARSAPACCRTPST